VYCVVKVFVSGVAESPSTVCMEPWSREHSCWVSTGNWVSLERGKRRWQVVQSCCRKVRIVELLVLVLLWVNIN